MKTASVCVLKLLIISLMSSQTGAYVLCNFVGTVYDPTNKSIFSVSKVPSRCQGVIYAGYQIDFDDVKKSPMYSEDENSIAELKANGKEVFTYVAYANNTRWLSDILSKINSDDYNMIIDKLVSKVSHLKLDGIILNIQNLYVEKNYDDKIASFVDDLRKKLTNVKIGIAINVPSSYKNFHNPELFDFSKTNKGVHFYFLDMHTHELYVCSENFFKYGTIISSPDDNLLSLEKMSNAINASNMSQDKAIASILIEPATEGSEYQFFSYSHYCKDVNREAPNKWCINKPKHLKEIGQFLKKQNFYGLSIDFIEYDDATNICECQGEYGATNALIDGWDESDNLVNCKNIK